ncbi:gasdermin-C [Enhydra lutris kenyoni]|uniref:Gasdermin-C n=1 Tax=Enhydra lutris kenyoni TaxID=391180 RepID=A0A2Y9JAV4_ENHLU|nr:gasdermin-C [Enhydra lutris kenyoni]
MPSLFERISKILVKEIGAEDLRPMRPLESVKKYRSPSILRKRRTRSGFWESPDVPAEYTLTDFLEPGSSVPEIDVSGPFHLSDSVGQKQKASTNVTAGLEVNVSREATECRGSSLQFQVVSILTHKWKDLQKRKALDPKLLLLVKSQDRGNNLYVVTETVELTQSTELHDSRSGQCQGEVHKVTEKMLTLSQGTVLAYKRKQLLFEENGWDILTPDDDKPKTFPGRAWVFKSGNTKWFTGFIPLPGRECRFLLQEFEHLQEETFQEMEALSLLSQDAQDAIFHTILNMLGNQEALQDLTDELDRNPWDPLDSFGGKILNEMQEDIRDLWIQERFHIIYLLEAIMVLSDTQHDLLAQSMKKKILLQQQELVRSILEPNFKYFEDIPFTLKPELLATLQDEDLAITYGLLQECGLNMELNSPSSTWDLEAKQPLSALYGTLSLLQRLAVSPERPAPPHSLCWELP